MVKGVLSPMAYGVVTVTVLPPPGKFVPLGAVTVMVPLLAASAPVALVIADTVQVELVAP
jgi:hypothetical protein